MRYINTTKIVKYFYVYCENIVHKNCLSHNIKENIHIRNGPEIESKYRYYIDKTKPFLHSTY